MWEQKDFFYHERIRAVGLVGGLQCVVRLTANPELMKNARGKSRVL